MEYLNRGEVTLALDVLRKRVSALRVDRCEVHSLANALLSFNDGDVVCDLRGKLLMDLEKVLPPPVSVPDGRLEHLVETTVTAWVDSCLYHSSANPISLYEDHHCGRDQFPTTTTQNPPMISILSVAIPAI
ncbi:WD repeat-containing protein 26-like [Trifolium medium]|uniref:WD repeat-containing protein 26-like n=1 Tax=Trifolium medium TaxID=97028 RepID=A0A392MBN0_9FABA|nr:WD repeat-containing protein 26-like [Trifolium medium]